MAKCGYQVNAIICVQESDNQGTNTYPVHVARLPGHFIGRAAHTSGMKGQQLCAYRLFLLLLGLSNYRT